MYKLDETTGKQRKIGGEAPSSRVFKSLNAEIIIGMMAENVQLLVSVYSLNNEDSKIIVTTLEDKFKDVKKLNLVLVVNNSFEDIESFKTSNNITKTIITQDKNGDFAKRFGVGLEGDEYNENIANGIFIIDKEAELKGVEYFLTVDENKLNEIYDLTMETVNFKQTGHTHENWMGA
jgi:thiol peroxidase